MDLSDASEKNPQGHDRGSIPRTFQLRHPRPYYYYSHYYYYYYY
jgi:hypothetical protein